MNLFKKLLTALFSITCSTSLFAATWNVATTGNDSSGNGEVSSPFATIQKAIDTAASSDTISVASGTYSGAGNANLNFLGKTLQLVSQSGPEATLVDAGQQKIARLVSGEGPETLIKGFTFFNGYHNASGDWERATLFEINNSSATLEDCIFRDNFAEGTYHSGTSGATLIGCWSGNATLKNCLLYNNTVKSGDNASSSDLIHGNFQLIENCTIANNTIDALMTNWWFFISKSRLQIFASETAIPVKNSIIWGNTISTIGDRWEFSPNTSTPTQPTHSYSITDFSAAGIGVKNENPLFVNPSQGDFSLQAGSPAIDSGDPSSSYESDNTRADMGYRVPAIPQTTALALVKTLPPNGLTLFSDTVGYQFTVGSKPLNVQSLGVATGLEGLLSQNTVGLWDEQGELLAVVFIPTNSIADGRFIWKDLATPITLLPYQTYMVGAAGSGGTGEYRLNGFLELTSDVSLVGFARNNQQGVFSKPSYNGTNGQGAVGANLKYTVQDLGKTDSDGDGVNDYREQKDGTDPNNASFFDPLSKGLAAYYSFNGTYQSDAGVGDSAIPNKTVGFVEDSIFGNVVKITGAGFIGEDGGSIEIPEPNLKQSNLFTASFWIKEHGMSHFHGEAYLTAGTAAGSRYLIAHYGNESEQTFLNTEKGLQEDIGKVADYQISIDGSTTSGVWNYYTIVEKDGVIRIFMNGNELYSTNTSGSPRGNWHIGRHWWDSGASQSTRLVASIANLRIYNRALRSDEVSQLYSKESGVNAQNFSYDLLHINQADAEKYLVSSSNLRKYSEWQSPVVTYWGPTTNGVEGELVYKFPLGGNSTQIRLKASDSSWDFYNEPGGNGRGCSMLEASRDGVTWVELKNSLNPRQWGVDWSYENNLPQELLGSAELWVRVKMYVENSPNSSYTVAQFGRSSSAATAPVFSVRAQINGSIIPDTTAPVITLNGANPQEIYKGASYTDPGAVVTDDIDAPQTIQGSGTVSTLELGVYMLTYAAADAAGNAAQPVTRTINVVLDPQGDEDGDELTNGQEEALGTNPENADSDGDEVSDRAEYLVGTDPKDAADFSSAPIGDACITVFRDFDATLQPGVWHGFILAATEKDCAYFAKVTPYSDETESALVEKVVVQSEYNGSVWNDVLRISAPANQGHDLRVRVRVFKASKSIENSGQNPAVVKTHNSFAATLEPGIWHGWVLGPTRSDAGYLVKVTPDSSAKDRSVIIDKVVVQSEYDGNEWRDVLRISMPSDQLDLPVDVCVFQVAPRQAGDDPKTFASLSQIQSMNATFTPGVWHGYSMGIASTKRAYLSKVTPLTNEISAPPLEKVVFQSEWNGTVWNDVLRLVSPASGASWSGDISVFEIQSPMPADTTRPNCFLIQSFQAGSTTEIDDLKITNLDTGIVVYENTFDAASDATRGLNSFYWPQGGKDSDNYVLNGSKTRVESGKLILETTGFNQNGYGGYESHSEMEPTANLPTNFRVEFTARRLQWAGHTHFMLFRREASDATGAHTIGGSFSANRTSGSPLDLILMSASGSWFNDYGIMTNFGNPNSTWAQQFTGPAGSLQETHKLAVELQGDAVSFYLDGSLLKSTSVTGWSAEPETVTKEFSYDLLHINQADSEKYLVSSTNLRKYSEWQSPAVSYWGPTTNGVEGELVYKFPLGGNSTQIFLKASDSSWDFYNEPGGNGRGCSMLEASRDGVTWVELKNSLNPRQWGVDWSYENNLPQELLGSAELWVRVKMYVENSPNSSYTVAQFGRSSSAATEPVFSVRAQVNGSIIPDTTAPVITLNGENSQEVYKGSSYTDPGAVVTDDVDAPQTIQGSGTVSTLELGVYTITYAATDAAGNAAEPVTRTINVVLDPAGDEDGDGLTNAEEQTLGTDPTKADSDNDGVTDYHEQKDGTDPNNPYSFNELSKGLGVTIYVNQNATGANNGTSWTDAYTSLDSALATAHGGNAIWIAAGTYKPSSNGNIDAYFSVSKSFSIFGGFNGTETTLNQRDWNANPTILSGDLGGNDTGPGSNQYDNSKRVIVVSNTSGVIIDGISITGGNCPTPGVGPDTGAGLDVFSSMTIRNCKFFWNYAISYGGGLAVRGEGVQALIENCSFTNNVGDWNGGGAMFVESASATIKNSYFANNSGSRGGAVQLNGTQNIRFENSVFVSNYSRGGLGSDGGGAIWIFNSPGQSLEVIHCTFLNNSNSRGSGGAIRLDHEYDSGLTLIANSIFVGSGLNAILNVQGTITNNLFDAAISGVTTSLDSPTFTDPNNPLGGDGVFGTRDDGLILAQNSNGIAQALSAYSLEVDATDSKRPVSPVADVGAYQTVVYVQGPIDSDGDGVNDYLESKDGTDPNNSLSFDPLSKGLVACYPFNGNAKDESGWGRDGAVVSGSFGSDRFGKEAGSFTITQDSNYATIPLNNAQFSGDLTIVSIVSFEDFQKNFPHILFGENSFLVLHGLGPAYQWNGKVGEVTYLEYIRIDNSDFGWMDFDRRSEIYSSKKLNPKQWYQICVTRTTVTTKLFIDGILCGSVASKDASLLSGNFMQVGKGNLSDPNQSMRGSIDDLKFYNRTLSAAEVSHLYAKESGNPNMVTVQGGTLPQGSGLAGQAVGDFQIGKFEVTWAEWKKVRDWAVENGYTDLENVGAGSGDDHPVRNVSWYDVVKWCNAKSEMEGLGPVYEKKRLALDYGILTSVYRTGQLSYESVNGIQWGELFQIHLNSSANGYRLPAESEWEWAARGGVKSQGYTYSGSNDVKSVAWTGESSPDGTQAVGTKAENELGIYDMTGNVWEWCNIEPQCIRGGSWNWGADIATLDFRGYYGFDPKPAFFIGFRIARNSVNSDTTAPVITLDGANPQEIYKGASHTDPGAVVTDNVDAPRTIQGSGTVNTSVLGVYTITYAATDAAGNAAEIVTRTINVVLDPQGDEDGDGLTNAEEQTLGTDLYNPDTDGDGYTDGDEVDAESDPLLKESYPSNIPFIRRGDSIYVIVEGPSWQEAEANAVKLGGHLVTINDDEENKWLVDNLTWKGDVGPSGVRAYWIGLNDTQREGELNWVDGSESAYRRNAASDYYTDEDWFTLTKLGEWNDIDQTPGSYGMGHWNMRFGIAEIKIKKHGDSAYVIVQGSTWEEAEVNAIKLGGHLVTINGAAEDLFLTEMMSEKVAQIGVSRVINKITLSIDGSNTEQVKIGPAAWIGLHSDPSWSNTSPHVSAHPVLIWSSREQNNYRGMISPYNSWHTGFGHTAIIPPNPFYFMKIVGDGGDKGMWSNSDPGNWRGGGNFFPYTAAVGIAEVKLSNMVNLQGGTLPEGSALAGQTVEDFEIGRTEVTWGEWKAVRDWAVANGYSDLANVGAGVGEDHPVHSVSWYDIVKWCNAKSELEGLTPVYELVKPLAVPLYIGYPGPFEETEIFRTGAPDESQFIRPIAGEGYRLPFEKEWEWAARGGMSSQGFTYSGSNNAATVGVFGSNSTSSVGKKSPNELGLYDMSGNVWEWLFDKDSNNTEDKRFFRGGGWTDVDATYCAVGQRYVSYHAGYAPANLGFRLARNAAGSVDTTLPTITLIGSNPLSVYKGSVFTDPGAIVTDDTDMQMATLGSGSVDTMLVGNYTLTYSAQDSAGNVATPVTRGVSVVLDPAGDEDGDALSNAEESALGTNPYQRDTDSDGIADHREIKDGTNPIDAASFNPQSVGLFAYLPFSEAPGTDLLTIAGVSSISTGENSTQEIQSGSVGYKNIATSGNKLRLAGESETIISLDRTNVEELLENNGTYASMVLKIPSGGNLSSQGVRVFALNGGPQNVPVASLWIRDVGGFIEAGMQRGGQSVQWNETKHPYDQSFFVVLDYAWEIPWGRPGGLHGFLMPPQDYLLEEGAVGIGTNASFWTYAWEDSYLPTSASLFGNNSVNIEVDEIRVGAKWTNIVQLKSKEDISYKLFGLESNGNKVVLIDQKTGNYTDFATLPFDVHWWTGFDYNPADGLLYVNEAFRSDGDQFYTIDPQTGVVALSPKKLAQTANGALDSFGFSSDGVLYGYDELSAFSQGTLLAVDWDTMEVSARPSNSGTPNVLGSDFDESRNVVWVTDEWNGKVYQLDPATGSNIWTSASSWPGGNSGDLWDVDVTPSGEVLFAATLPDGQNKILKIDPASGLWAEFLNLPAYSIVNQSILRIASAPTPSPTPSLGQWKINQTPNGGQANRGRDGVDIYEYPANNGQPTSTFFDVSFNAIGNYLIEPSEKFSVHVDILDEADPTEDGRFGDASFKDWAAEVSSYNGANRLSVLSYSIVEGQLVVELENQTKKAIGLNGDVFRAKVSAVPDDLTETKESLYFDISDDIPAKHLNGSKAGSLIGEDREDHDDYLINILDGVVPVSAPAITSVTTASGTVGTEFNYTITGSNSPTSYAATGLPFGLTINAATGVISGTPTSAGTSTVPIGATNVGGSGTGILTITINPIPAPPGGGGGSGGGGSGGGSGPNTVDWLESKPTNRQFSMTVYAKVLVDNILKSNPQNLLGAFDKDGLAGASAPVGQDNGVFVLTIWRDANIKETIDLKFYDAVSGRIYFIAEELEFSKDSQAGTLQEPMELVPLYEEVELSINVAKGWNWVSFGVLPARASIERVFGDYLFTDNDLIKGANGFVTFFQGKWYPEDFTLEAGRMYSVRRQAEGSVAVGIIGGEQDASDGISLVKGWNWLGFTPGQAMAVGEALASLQAVNGDLIKGQTLGSVTFNNRTWVPESAQLLPGRGYMLRVEKEQNFRFEQPALAEVKADNSNGEQSPSLRMAANAVPKVLSATLASTTAPAWTAPEGKANNMVVFAAVKIDGKAVEAAGSRLAAFDGSQTVGVAEIKDGPNGKCFSLQIQTDSADGATISFKAYNAASGKTVDLKETVPFQADGVVAGIDTPKTFTYTSPRPPSSGGSGGGGGAAPSGGGSSQVQPSKKGKGAKKSSASKSGNAKSKSDSGSSAKKSSASKSSGGKKSGTKKSKKK